MIKNKIRVLIVDDSIMFREVMIRGISNDPGLEVVGGASDAYSARDKILSLRPDVMTLDIEMPGLNGIDFLKKLMPQYPLPVVVVSGADERIFDALNSGAVDFVEKPDVSSHQNINTFISELIIKIKIASTAHVGRFKAGRGNVALSSGLDNRIVAIGASTGGTEAILAVLKDLPTDIPGIVVVQHMPPVFTKMYADRLNNICRIEVSEASDGDVVTSGKALIAPGGFQLKVLKDRGRYYVHCFTGEKVNGHSPSVDVMFHSVADAAGADAAGIILTGMGADGAKGLKHMREQGAYTIGQDESTCVVYGMPEVAYEIGAVCKQCPLNKIGGELLGYLREHQA